MENSISFSDFWNYLAEPGAAFWCGVIVTIAVFAIEVVLCAKKIIFAGDEKKLEKARKAGHILTGKMVHYRFNDSEPDSYGKGRQRMHIATYEYTVNGKTKTHQVISTSVKPANTIYLYYVSNPNRVFSEWDLKPSPFQLLLYIIPVAIGYFVATALGYKP